MSTHPDTAQTVARALGLSARVYADAEDRYNAMPEDVEPEDRARITDELEHSRTVTLQLARLLLALEVEA